MSMHQYIGARYVPKFYQNSLDPLSCEWEPNVTYESLTMVTTPNNHAYISKKTVPDTVGTPADNAEYWLETGNFNAYIADLQDQVDEINNTTIPAVNDHIDNVEERVLHKKIIFIGDSYQWGGGLSGDGNKWDRGWLGVCTTALGLTENVDFWHDEYPGRGFTTSTSFLDMIQALSIGTEDPDNITDIIVTGGLNDTSGANSLNTAIPAFVSYCKSAYPNAKVHVGYIGNYGENAQLRFDGRNVSVYYQAFANKSGACYINNSQYLLHDSMYYTVDENWHPNQLGHNEIGYKMANYILNSQMEAIYGYHGVTFTLSTDVFETMEGTAAFSAMVNNNISTIKSQNLLRFRSNNGISIDSSSKLKLGTITACGINPAIGGYSEVPVSVTFNNYVNGAFVYETWPSKIVYEFDSSGNRNLYLVTSAPVALNSYSAWIGPFDMVMDTNLT